MRGWGVRARLSEQRGWRERDGESWSPGATHKLLQRKELGAVLAAVKGEGGGAVDGHGAGVRALVHLVARVEALRVKVVGRGLRGKEGCRA